jgi:hypothetical protein
MGFSVTFIYLHVTHFDHIHPLCCHVLSPDLLHNAFHVLKSAFNFHVHAFPLNSTHERKYAMMSLLVWLISINMMTYTFDFPTNDIIIFLFVNELCILLHFLYSFIHLLALRIILSLYYFK